MKARVDRRMAAALAISAVAGATMVSGAVAAEPAGGPSWRPPVNVRTANNVQLQDADFHQHGVAVTWTEPGSAGLRARFRNSVDSGNGFGVIESINNARQSELEICGESGLVATWAKRDGSDWDIQVGEGGLDFFGGGFAVADVATGPREARDPDVACTNGPIIASYFERALGGGDRLKVAFSDPSTGDFGAPEDLGLDDEVAFARTLVVAGVNGDAYAAFSRSDGDLRFKRWSVGSGPVFDITPHATQLIGTGTVFEPVHSAVIAAAGDKVAVAWTRCNAMQARVSNDRGETWGPIRNLFGSPCIEDAGAAPTHIAIKGERIALTYVIFSAFGSPSTNLIRTTNDFANRADDQIAGLQDDHHVGFVTGGGTVKLAAVFDKGDHIRFRRQQ